MKYYNLIMGSIALAILLFLLSCGKVRTENKVAISGETYSYIVVKFQFLDEIKELCSGIYPENQYNIEVERTRLISQCTLDKMSILDLDALGEFNNNICDNPSNVQESDICEVINGSEVF